MREPQRTGRQNPAPAAGAGEPWREPARGGHPDARIAALTGAGQLEALLTGATPQPPISHLTGMRLTELGAGTATFELPLSEWLCGSDGYIPLGVVTIPADGAMACAAISHLPAATGLTTTELSLRQLRPCRPGGTLYARAEVIDMGPPVALAEVSVTDDHGTLMARGSSLCVTTTLSAAPAGTETETESAPPATGAHHADPWERQPAGDLAALTGLSRVPAAPGRAEFTLPATRWLCAPPPGRVQGGAVATLADAAITAVIRDAAGGGAAFMPIELGLNYLRPLTSDGRDAVARAELVHAGRRIGMARAEVTDADGRLIAVAGGSAISTGDGQ